MAWYPGVLPAYAGMIRHREACLWHVGGAPRVCGDDPAGRSPDTPYMVCSPRMRG